MRSPLHGGNCQCSPGPRVNANLLVASYKLLGRVRSEVKGFETFNLSQNLNKVPPALLLPPSSPVFGKGATRTIHNLATALPPNSEFYVLCLVSFGYVRTVSKLGKPVYALILKDGLILNLPVAEVMCRNVYVTFLFSSDSFANKQAWKRKLSEFMSAAGGKGHYVCIDKTFLWIVTANGVQDRAVPHNSTIVIKSAGRLLPLSSPRAECAPSAEEIAKGAKIIRHLWTVNLLLETAPWFSGVDREFVDAPHKCSQPKGKVARKGLIFGGPRVERGQTNFHLSDSEKPRLTAKEFAAQPHVKGIAVKNQELGPWVKGGPVSGSKGGKKKGKQVRLLGEF